MQCENLEAVELPYGIRRIQKAAFSECISLRSIRIPATVRAIERYAFQNTQLTEDALCIPRQAVVSKPIL